MSNPTFQSREDKLKAQQAWIEAKAAKAAAIAHEIETRKAYADAKAATSQERREHFQAIATRRAVRMAKKEST